jgi:hypothetical protein
MTKAQQILDLYDGIRTTTEIAKVVGCDPAYVRVVARQRFGSGQSEIDRRHWENGGRERVRDYMRNRRHADPEYRERTNRHCRNSQARRRAQVQSA